MHGTNMLQEVSMSFIENMDSNIVLFEGMSEKSLYLVYLTKNQVFRTVDRENVLSAWSSVSGKLLHKYQLEGEAQLKDA